MSRVTGIVLGLGDIVVNKRHTVNCINRIHNLVGVWVIVLSVVKFQHSDQ